MEGLSLNFRKGIYTNLWQLPDLMDKFKLFFPETGDQPGCLFYLLPFNTALEVPAESQTQDKGIKGKKERETRSKTVITDGCSVHGHRKP